MSQILDSILIWRIQGLFLDFEPDFEKKINRFQGICGTIRKRFTKNPYRNPNEIA
jgi:hypothetical protein